VSAARRRRASARPALLATAGSTLRSAAAAGCTCWAGRLCAAALLSATAEAVDADVVLVVLVVQSHLDPQAQLPAVRDGRTLAALRAAAAGRATPDLPLRAIACRRCSASSRPESVALALPCAVVFMTVLGASIRFGAAYGPPPNDSC